MRCRRILPLLLLACAVARADKIDELATAIAKDPSFKVRVQAVVALGRSTDPRAVLPLIAALRDENEVVRGMAVNSLALIGDERALQPLLAARHDASPLVRDKVEKALPAFQATLKKPGAAEADPAPPPLPPPPPHARYYVTTDVTVKGAPSVEAPRIAATLADQTLRALARIPRTAVTLPASTASAGKPGAPRLPDAKRLATLRLAGYVVSGTLTPTMNRAGTQLGCAWSGVIATFPAREIRATQNFSADVSGSRGGRLDGKQALAQCLEAVAGGVADETKKFLATVR